MASQGHYGGNLLQNYRDIDSLINVVGEMQQGKTRFNEILLGKARNDAKRNSRKMDESTYPFGEDIADHLYDGQLRRVVMFVQGIFHGNSNIPTIIPVDLGNNTYPLFQQSSGNSTIDDNVTFDKTREFLDHYIETHGDELGRRGVYKFEVGKSRFFYFRESDLVRFFSRFGVEVSNGKTIPFGDLALLAPLTVPTRYVALDEVDLEDGLEPSPEWYREIAPVQVSHRLKNSLEDKLVNRLTTSEGIKDGSVRLVADWVAHRPVVPTLEDVYKLEAFLKENPTMGNSQIEYRYTNNKYREEERKKGSSRDFKALNVIVEVTTNGFSPAIREIQIVDQEQYFRNELSKEGDNHDLFKARRSNEDDMSEADIIKRKSLRKVLSQIFVPDNNDIPIHLG